MIYFKNRFSSQLSSASLVIGVVEYDKADRNLISAIVADASKLDVEMNPNPLHWKHKPLARRYPSFPEPLHLWHEFEGEVMVIWFVMVVLVGCVSSG